MRLNPGITIDRADEVLRQAELKWNNVRTSHDFRRTYTDAIYETYLNLKQVFATPDVSSGMRSMAY